MSPARVLILVSTMVALPGAALAATAAKAPRGDPPAALPAPPSADPGCETTLAKSSDERITYFRHCPDSPELVSFRGGRFAMGDAVGNGQPYELPVHEVTLQPFAIGRYEVTRGEWQACVAAGACTPPGPIPPETVEAGGRHPVTRINWNQARAYVAWLAQRTGRPYRLPSEAEWEYAARAGETGNFGWNPNAAEPQTCQYANVLDRAAYQARPELDWFVGCSDGYAETAPVGSFKANAWGVHDMQGNVWEWVEDCWHPSYEGAPSDGSAWVDDGGCRKRVNRGGGWGNGTGTLRLSARDADPAGGLSDGLGFRVALSVAVRRP